jgi:hypothetical protein
MLCRGTNKRSNCLHLFDVSTSYTMNVSVRTLTVSESGVSDMCCMLQSMGTQPF